MDQLGSFMIYKPSKSDLEFDILRSNLMVTHNEFLLAFNSNHTVPMVTFY